MIDVDQWLLADGFGEDVKMIMQTIDIYDVINIRKIVADRILLKTNIHFLPTDERNLVVKIAIYMRKHYNLKEGLFINLEKRIPIGAGLGGGSADAGATIKGINQLFSLDLSLEEMIEIGGKFGADIPYCILGKTALAQGIGEQLSIINGMLPMEILIVKPKVSVSTGYIYGQFDLVHEILHPDIDGMIKAIEKQDLDSIVTRLGNVLEPVTNKKYPEVEKIKNGLLKAGAKGALMSGSGSAVFAIFKDKVSMRKAAIIINRYKEIEKVFETKTINRNSEILVVK